MFKPSLIYAILVIALTSMPALSGETDSEESRLSGVLNPANTERMLLVAFSDLHIDRIQMIASSASYRRRGPYKSSTWSQRVSRSIEQQHGLQKLTEWPMTEVGVHCAVYLVPAGISVAETMQALSQDNRVDIVQRMHQFKTKGMHYNDPYYRLQSNMHQLQIEQAHVAATGKNVSIAVIDTGIDYGHPDLAGQIESNENFVSSVSAGFSDDLHGTAVAGVIAAQKDNRTGIIGVAPDAKLVALKACWPNQAGSFEAVCNSYTLALAVNTAIKLGVNVLNMSLAGPEDPLLAMLLNKAKEKGIVVVAADPGSKEPENRFPASMESVIPVQALDKLNNESSPGIRAINAPGEHILTTLPFGTYDFVSGSSVAAAQVTGVVALMLELKPGLSVDQTKAILQQSIRVPGSYHNSDLSAGLNAGKIVRSLCKETRCP